MNDKKIYIIEKGSYSDRRIIRVMSDKTKAETYKERLVDDSYDGSISIEEITIDADLDYDKIGWRIVRTTVNSGCKDYDLELSDYKTDTLVEGQVVWIAKPIDVGALDAYYIDAFPTYDYCKVGCFGIERPNDKYIFYILAPDKGTALKIANEVYSSVRILEDTGAVHIEKIYSINGLKVMNEDGIL